MNISGIVLASGLSKRMNQNKLQLEINNKKIYEYILSAVKECDFSEVIVVAKDEEILKRAHELGYKSIKNAHSHLGQSTSIKLALEHCKCSKGFMFFVADQPFITVSTIQMLCHIFNNNPKRIIVPCINGNNRNPVIFPSYLEQELMTIEGDRGGRVVINNNPELILKVKFEEDYEFFDIDTLEDYNKVKDIKL